MTEPNRRKNGLDRFFQLVGLWWERISLGSFLSDLFGLFTGFSLNEFREAFNQTNDDLASMTVNVSSDDYDRARAVMKFVFACVMIILALLVAGYVVWVTWLYPAKTPDYPAPSMPQVQPTLTPSRAAALPWEAIDVLHFDTVEQRKALPNMINFAVIGGGVKYLDASVACDSNLFKPDVQPRDPIKGVSLIAGGTAAQVSISGIVFTFNVCQPFALLNSPGTVYMIDAKGALLSAPLTRDMLIPLDQAIPHLPQEIAPNDDLSNLAR